jgi:serine carboxypeptidase-like clade 1
MTVRKDILVLLISLITTVTLSEPQDDKLSQIPGYPSTFRNRAFAGYLNTDSNDRKLHYVFLEANQGVSNSAPVLLWLNGGPGCTSKIGFVQEISPYCLDASQKYEAQDILKFNPYGWSNLTNMLFIDSPAGVGYSINKDVNYVYNDANTAKDNLLALKYFFRINFPEYANNAFYIAG